MYTYGTVLLAWRSGFTLIFEAFTKGDLHVIIVFGLRQGMCLVSVCFWFYDLSHSFLFCENALKSHRMLLVQCQIKDRNS